ncbi:probable G-protein coupled receptor 148 [Carcharodon carcharias]|uniref:probable G-protein coupled receptor 148 n=1 Tax=Carcharodon carcharias TaxID=13397 RepID=UPI001B7DB268|nr:probable G-protein coupled receptor 148 [Carcharodon carcharias]
MTLLDDECISHFHTNGSSTELPNSTNASSTITEIYLQWIHALILSRTRLIIVPGAICFFASLIASTPILLAIFTSSSLCQESRYLLLSNALISDLIYLVINFCIQLGNISQLSSPKFVCELLLFTLTTTSYCGLMTITTMVIDTYLAINWPLHYITLFPPSRAVRLVILIWIVVAFPQFIITAVMLITQQSPFCKLTFCEVDYIFLIVPHGAVLTQLFYGFLIALLLSCICSLLSCYFMLYWKTRNSGIWSGFSSRARLTFLMHFVVFAFYFCSMLLIVVERILYNSSMVKFKIPIFIARTMSNIIMMAPKALAPYLYGMRYRELAKVIKSFFFLKDINQVEPIH